MGVFSYYSLSRSQFLRSGFRQAAGNSLEPTVPLFGLLSDVNVNCAKFVKK